jgi:hypothetical protein
LLISYNGLCRRRRRRRCRCRCRCRRRCRLTPPPPRDLFDCCVHVLVPSRIVSP